MGPVERGSVKDPLATLPDSHDGSQDSGVATHQAGPAGKANREHLRFWFCLNLLMSFPVSCLSDPSSSARPGRYSAIPLQCSLRMVYPHYIVSSERGNSRMLA